jgi:hypothetical protein
MPALTATLGPLQAQAVCTICLPAFRARERLLLAALPQKPLVAITWPEPAEVQAGLELLPALVLALAFLALAYPVLAARALRAPLRLNPLRVNLCSAADWALRDLEPALLALVVLRERLALVAQALLGLDYSGQPPASLVRLRLSN